MSHTLHIGMYSYCAFVYTVQHIQGNNTVFMVCHLKVYNATIQTNSTYSSATLDYTRMC